MFSDVSGWSGGPSWFGGSNIRYGVYGPHRLGGSCGPCGKGALGGSVWLGGSGWSGLPSRLILGIFLLFNLIQKYFQMEKLSLMIPASLMV